MASEIAYIKILIHCSHLHQWGSRRRIVHHHRCVVQRMEHWHPIIHVLDSDSDSGRGSGAWRWILSCVFSCGYDECVNSVLLCIQAAQSFQLPSHRIQSKIIISCLK